MTTALARRQTPTHPLPPIKSPRIYIDLRNRSGEKWGGPDPADPVLATPLGLVAKPPEVERFMPSRIDL